jgi:hypothetical protein
MDSLMNVISKLLPKYEKLSKKTLDAQMVFHAKQYLINSYGVDFLHEVDISAWQGVIKFHTNNSAKSAEIKMHETTMIEYIKKQIPDVEIKGLAFR